MDASLAGLVRAGKITLATAETRSSQPAELRRLIEGGLDGVPQAVAA
jgi:twitching motility protein PilT